MKKIENAFGPWVIRYRAWIILLTILCIAIPSYGLKYVYFDSEYRNFIGDSLPSVVDMNFIEGVFNKQDNILIVLAPKNGDVFTVENLAYIEELTELAWQLPYSQRVDSLSNFQHTRADGDDLIVRALVENARLLSAEQLFSIKTIALSEPRLSGNLVSTRGDVAGINVLVSVPSENKSLRVVELVDATNQLLEKYRDEGANLDVFINGSVAQDYMVEHSSKQDMRFLLPIVMLVMAIILFFAIGSLTTVLLTLVIVAFSIVTALGLGSALGIHITPPVSASPTIILTVAIASCVHILVNFTERMQQGLEKNQAIVESLRVNLQPIVLASVTTVFGFLTLNFAKIPPFQDLGNVVSIGVVSSLFLALFTLPACLSYVPIKIKPALIPDQTMMATFGEFVIRHYNKLLWLTLAILLGASISASNNVFNDNPLKYFKKTNSYSVSTVFTNERLTGLTSLEFYLDSGVSGGISNPDFLRDVESFSSWLSDEPDVNHVSTFTDTMKRLNRNMHGDYDEHYVLPETQGLGAQYLLLYEMSLPYGLDLANEINIDKSAIRLLAKIKTPDDLSFVKLQKKSLEWVNENTTHIVDAKASSLFFAYSNVSIASSKILVFGTFIALALISVLLSIAFRSYRVGLISFISNLAPAIVGFGVWGMLVGEIGAGTSIVAAVTIGIVVDDTVHMFSKYLRARREHGATPDQAIVYALKTVGRALVVTSIVLVGGFLVLLFSDFRLSYEMGLLSSIVIACALGTVFLLVPSLLMKFPKVD